MSDIAKNELSQIYKTARASVIKAQHTVYTAVNSAMVTACGENDRAEYGKGLIKFISENLTKEFGKGFTERNLRVMRQFYCAFPKRHTLCAELSWSHYRRLLRIENEKIRKFYADECVKSEWSVR